MLNEHRLRLANGGEIDHGVPFGQESERFDELIFLLVVRLDVHFGQRGVERGAQFGAEFRSKFDLVAFERTVDHGTEPCGCGHALALWVDAWLHGGPCASFILSHKGASKNSFLRCTRKCRVGTRCPRASQF